MTLVAEIEADAGAVRLQDGIWKRRCDLGQLVSYLGLLRRLWARGAKVAGQPGPWAAHYAAEIAAIELAVREMELRAPQSRAPGFGALRDDRDDDPGRAG